MGPGNDLKPGRREHKGKGQLLAQRGHGIRPGGVVISNLLQYALFKAYVLGGGRQPTTLVLRHVASDGIE